MKTKQPTSIQDRILLRMRDLGLKNKDLVKATNASRGTVSQWVNGGNKPSADFLPKLAKALNVTEEWLISGGAIFARGKNQDSLDQSVRKIPLLLLEQAGDWRSLMNAQKTEKWISIPNDVSSSSFAVVMNNDSMVSAGSVSIPEDAIVVVDPEVEVIPGKIVLAQVGATACTIKKLMVDGENLYLIPLNSNYKPILIASLSQVIGVCVSVQTKLP
ncbi:LexA family protein [Serratia ureilytica]|uniref:LexA family protein n=1 Tax=Serratia ureilytica TaxID=300181 RepID=UPI00384B18B4